MLDITISWPIGVGGGILLEFSQSYDENDNVIIEIYDNQMHRVLRNTFSASGSYGSFPTQIGGVFLNDSLVYKAISQSGNNDCATTSGKDGLYVDDGTNVFSGVKCIGTNSAMPITYSKPLEAAQKQTSTILTWSVASQINNDKYIIEHSTDGRSFSPIEEIEGDGTYNEERLYDYTHDNPSIGVNYYRIKQIDYDGTSGYSNIASVNYNGYSREIAIYPNPATDEVKIYTPNNTNLTLTDIYGRTTKTLSIIEGGNSLDIRELPSGFYIFALQNGDRYKILKE